MGSQTILPLVMNRQLSTKTIELERRDSWLKYEKVHIPFHLSNNPFHLCMKDKREAQGYTNRHA